jgi:hypothetical protein
MTTLDKPILITGCARSGTSMTAGIINICGAWGGEMSGPNNNNQKGMFENHAIRQNLTKPQLKAAGFDPMGQKPLPTDEYLATITDEQALVWKRKVLTLLKSQGLLDGMQWFYKGAKMCLVWPLWAKAFPDAQWVIVRRKDFDIADSCMRTSFMRAYNSIEGWQSWVDVHKKRFQEMKDAGLDVLEVTPEDIIKLGDFSAIHKVIARAELNWDAPEINNFVAPRLWKRGK